MYYRDRQTDDRRDILREKEGGALYVLAFLCLVYKQITMNVRTHAFVCVCVFKW